MSLNVTFGVSTWLWQSPFTTASIELFPKIKAISLVIVQRFYTLFEINRRLAVQVVGTKMLRLGKDIYLCSCYSFVQYLPICRLYTFR
jgi:hypothetical protein